MIERERNVATGEKGHQSIDMVKVGTARRSDHRQPGRRHFLEQGAVADIRARDLENIHSKFDAFVDGNFVERGDHGHHSGIAHRFDELAEVDPAQLRIDSFLDVPNVGASAIIAVDERIHIAKLELDRGMDIVEPHHTSKITDDLQSTIKTSPMIIGELKHEQVFENGIGHVGLRHVQLFAWRARPSSSAHWQQTWLWFQPHIATDLDQVRDTDRPRRSDR